jgi:TIR domain/Pentapeptide repeats (8 copies)
MTNKVHVTRLRNSVEQWNTWRVNNLTVHPDLKGADLEDANLISANLSHANLNYANFLHADLNGANLNGANLNGANLNGANLIGANLMMASIINTDLSGANLSGAFLIESRVGVTSFGNLDLRTVYGLETVKHLAPSTIGADTIIRSGGDIPEVFLRGAGLTDTFITYARSLVNVPIEYYTCFISYSHYDEAFANHLYADLQSHDVRCWFAPEDMKIGDKIRPRIDETIRTFDKLLLVLSQHSIASNWVAYEVEKALDKEPQGIPTVLFPIRIDDTILTCNTQWAQDIKHTRHIGDFTHWKDHDTYQRSLERLLRALKASKPSKD